MIQNPAFQKWLHAWILLGAGALLPFALAPYGLWPLALVSTATLCALLSKLDSRRCLRGAFFYGLGLFGHGASWVYISIHDFGFTGVALALALTAIFVVFLALFSSIPFYLFGKIDRKKPTYLVLGFAVLWVIGEWLRSWMFTGFPWLYLGYAHIESPLAGFAAFGGVFLISFFSAVIASTVWIMMSSLSSMYQSAIPRRAGVQSLVSTLGAIAGLFLLPAALNQIEWTHTDEEAQSISIIQPNVELIRKWNPYFFPGIMSELDEAADQHWHSDIQLWPEAAIPSLFHDNQDYINDVRARASNTNTNVISGVLYDNLEPYEVYNSIVGLGAASGVYFKQKLVPFGEYVPLEDMLRGLIAFFDLPNSVIRRGPFRSNAISARSTSGQAYIVAPFICYEVVYPDFVADNAKNAKLLVTISNDAWFGNSIGPHQHFDMVRMRALENQKYFARSTNTGISAIINHRGEVLEQGDQFTREVISGQVQLREGVTPFVILGSYPIIIFCLVTLGFMLFRGRT